MCLQNGIKMALKFPRGFDLTAQILSEQTILDVACFIGWNKPQIDQLSYYFWVKASTGWERKGFRQYLPLLFLIWTAKMNLSCNSYSTARVRVIFQRFLEQILITHKCSQNFRRIQSKSLSFFWTPPAYFSAQLKAGLGNRAQGQVLSISKNYPNE